MKKQYSRSRDSGPFNLSIGRDVRLEVASAIPSKLRLEWKQYRVSALWMKLDTMITLYCDYRTWLSYNGTSTLFNSFFSLFFFLKEKKRFGHFLRAYSFCYKNYSSIKILQYKILTYLR